ncbi:hypothetical protein [Neokomagataea anthophila]|uniref:Uncharacterized protein n=1 Tax=Neokomagataea anthophila TaxID=2826925 RepID=A0ABS5E9K9_9PROT|nr:hypothetical protein [Neokomagataea anthophila]MBR0560577.1 hypothetical protein [Neokomagataea anthophila]
MIGLVLLFVGSVGGISAQEKSWLPEEGAKIPGNALAWPTVLEPVPQSLSEMLNQGAVVLLVAGGKEGPEVTLRFKRKVILCYVSPAPVGGVPTSRCWRLN